MAQIIENKGLTEKARANLERNEELRRSMGQGKYVHLADGEQRVFFFDAEKIQIVERESKWKPGTTSKQFEYVVVDPNQGDKEQLITFSKRWSEQIDALLMAGEGTRRLIKIKRIGVQKDTIYYIEAA